MITEKLTRWIHASINDYFTSITDSVIGSIPGYYDDNQVRKNDPIHFEVRLIGPDYTELDPIRTKVFVTIQILVTMEDIRVYERDSVIGLLQSKFINLPVYRYGGRSGDDNSFVFCLQLVNRTGKDVTTKTIHQPDKTSQSLIEAYYEGYYDGNV